MRPNKLEKPSSYFIFTDVTSKLFLLEWVVYLNRKNNDQNDKTYHRITETVS
jgi:hypothetical protein